VSSREVVSAVAWLVGVSLLGGLPSSHTTVDAGCTLRAKVVIVNLPNREDGPVLRHAWRAEAEHHWSDVWHIDREHAAAYIVSSVNRSAGSIMRHQLAPYCDNQAFRYERRPGPKPR
jgi:hypothetical protein